MFNGKHTREEIMNKLLAVIISLSILIGLAAFTTAGPEPSRFYDLNRNRTIEARQLVDVLKDKKVVLVGEHHTTVSHHQAQLAVIRMLHEAGVKVAVGLEMFRSESQPVLDRWTAGKIDSQAFERLYYDNWNYPWPLYRDIFEYARDNAIPMVGLNVPRDITRQVARAGYNSLSDDQRRRLGDVACRVDKEYMDYIRKAYGGHGHGNMNFLHFCEAQMVWDSAMAVATLEYLESNPERVVVILAGTGHVRKQAIPEQIRSRAPLPHAVILPEVPGMLDKQTLDSGDADFIFLDLD